MIEAFKPTRIMGEYFNKGKKEDIDETFIYCLGYFKNYYIRKLCTSRIDWKSSQQEAFKYKI